MIQEIRRANTKVGLHRSSLGVLRSVDQSRDPRMNKSAGTHRTGLDGRIQRSAREPVVADGERCSSQSDDLSVRGRIARSDHRVAATRYHASVENHYRANGDFVVFARTLRFGKRFSHELLVIRFHVGFPALKTNANVTEPSRRVSRK